MKQSVIKVVANATRNGTVLLAWSENWRTKDIGEITADSAEKIAQELIVQAHRAREFALRPVTPEFPALARRTACANVGNGQ